MIENFHDVFERQSDGVAFVRERTFSNEVIGNFVLYDNAPIGPHLIERVEFLKCSFGPIFAFGNVHLHKVIFRNCKCSDYNFYAGNNLERVVVEDGAGSILWVKRATDRKGNELPGNILQHPVDPDGICLDVSNFRGTLDLPHVHPRNIKIDPERHVICDRALLGGVDWRRHPVISKMAFKYKVFKLEGSDSDYFIGSIVDKSGNIDPELAGEIAELRRLGFVA